MVKVVSINQVCLAMLSEFPILNHLGLHDFGSGTKMPWLPAQQRGEGHLWCISWHTVKESLKVAKGVLVETKYAPRWRLDKLDSVGSGCFSCSWDGLSLRTFINTVYLDPWCVVTFRLPASRVSQERGLLSKVRIALGFETRLSLTHVFPFRPQHACLQTCSMWLSKWGCNPPPPAYTKQLTLSWWWFSNHLGTCSSTSKSSRTRNFTWLHWN